MANSDELFAGARVSTNRIAPDVWGMSVVTSQGTVIGRDTLLDTDDSRVVCTCGCGGYWIVEWDLLKAPSNRMSFLAHDLTMQEIVDQLAFRAKDPNA